MKTYRRFDWDRLEYVETTAIETNGNLVYVEDDNGNRDWVTRQELSPPIARYDRLKKGARR